MSASPRFVHAINGRAYQLVAKRHGSRGEYVVLLDLSTKLRTLLSTAKFKKNYKPAYDA